MKKLIKALFLLLIVVGVAAAVAATVSRKKFESMSDDEIRDFLAGKLDGKVADDQLSSIQDAVVAGVRGRRPGAPDHFVEEVEDAIDELTGVAAEAAETAGDSASDAAKQAGAKAAEAVEAVTDDAS
ncbi:MAG TPA: hypothetical protein VLA29_00705 [Acidimicrobiia bacterium]|nr:hypothetical protein [Acidimicrobiia bacterium]